MAASSTILDDFDEIRSQTTCPICLEMFVEPKILGACGHTICHNCTEELCDRELKRQIIPSVPSALRRQISVECPICRKLSVIPQDGFPANYELKGILTKLEEKDKRQKNCLGCFTFAPEHLFYFCKSCPSEHMWVCADCIIKKHSGHSLLTFKEFQQQTEGFCKTMSECRERLTRHYYPNLEKVIVAGSSLKKCNQMCHRALEEMDNQLTKNSMLLPSALTAYEDQVKNITELTGVLYQEIEQKQKEINASLKNYESKLMKLDVIHELQKLPGFMN